jgi:hypothetical protein
MKTLFPSRSEHHSHSPRCSLTWQSLVTLTGLFWSPASTARSHLTLAEAFVAHAFRPTTQQHHHACAALTLVQTRCLRDSVCSVGPFVYIKYRVHIPQNLGLYCTQHSTSCSCTSSSSTLPPYCKAAACSTASWDAGPCREFSPSSESLSC